MNDPHTHYRMYREEMARLERRLEQQAMLPPRKRRHLPQIGFGRRQRSGQPVAANGGC